MVDVTQLYAEWGSQIVLWGGHYQREEIRVTGKAQECRLGNVGAEDDGAY